MRVGELTEALLERFPAERAESWDRPGLSVGDPEGEVEGIACALDAIPETIRAARARGCNVLVTHHPAFLEAPFPVTPAVSTSSLAGSTVWAAVSCGVSLIALHTNLDRSEEALDLASEMLGLPRTGRLFEPDGYGALLDSGGVSAAELCDRCQRRFGTTPVLWGANDLVPGTVAFCSGSLGSFGSEAIRQGVGLVITGEAGYHDLSELACAVVGAILLGQDASELPYAGLLARVTLEVAPGVRIEKLDEGLRWHAWAAGK